MLSHPWLTMTAETDTKMTDEELQHYLQYQQQMLEIMDAPMLGEEMSKLDDTYTEINGADLENNSYSFLSEFEEQEESSDEEDDTRDDSQDEAAQLLNPKDQRDLAQGKNLNNSFVGGYPENWDHLHTDKGANPQFHYMNKQVENNIFELGAKIMGLKK